MTDFQSNLDRMGHEFELEQEVRHLNIAIDGYETKFIEWSREREGLLEQLEFQDKQLENWRIRMEDVHRNWVALQMQHTDLVVLLFRWYHARVELASLLARAVDKIAIWNVGLRQELFHMLGYLNLLPEQLKRDI